MTVKERVSTAGPMAGREPIVTIGVPVYNGEAMLGNMLDSLEAQTFRHFKVVICDNASTDRTAEIAEAFCARDPRFTYHRNPENIGANPNFNRVWDIDHSTPYYKWAAHDDMYAPSYLERCVKVLEREPDVVVAHSLTVLVDDTREGSAASRMLLAETVLDSFTDEAGRPAWTIGPAHPAESNDPVQRLDDLLNRMGGHFEIFGVMRTSALESTQLHANYYGSDRSLLAQLVLLGPFRHVPERLYVNRFHVGVSRSMTRAQLRKFSDARRPSRWRIARMYWDILRAPRVANVDLLTTFRCARVTVHNFFGNYSRRVWLKLRRTLYRHRANSAGLGEAARTRNENIL